MRKSYLFALLAVFTLSFTSCKKDYYDEPGASADPNLPVNTTIAELKAMFSGGSPYTITDDIIIQGTVIGDDKTGNIYKQIVIDDGTAGLPIIIESYDLYGLYPVGRKIYVKCKGLSLGTYGGTTQMGGYVDGTEVGRIPATLQDKYIVRGPLVTPIEPITVTIDELNPSMISRLIRVEDVEFVSSAANKEYADVFNTIPQDGNRNITDCNGKQMIVRTSSYADFAFAKTPKGKGAITGIYSVYRSDKQLTIRDTSEVPLRGIKCDGTDPNAILVYEETFESYTNGTNVIGDWTNFAEVGSKIYKVNNQPSSANNKYVQMSAFGNPQESSNITWLVSPSINMNASTNEKLFFNSAIGFPKAGTNFEILISTNYTGNVSTATWSTLTGRIAEAGDIVSGNFSPFISSGLIDISSYSGNVVLAFKYTGSGTGGQTSTYELDNVRIFGE